jgi:hypothetical protein
MKWVAIVILAGGLTGINTVFGQFVAPVPQPNPIASPSPPYGMPRAQNRPDLQGVVPQVIRLKKPWELINPFAPAEYGTGSANTTKDYPNANPTWDEPYDPAKPKGIILFGITW